MICAAMDDSGVEPERDVVEEEPATGAADVDPPLAAPEGIERADRILPVEAEIPGEVVPRPERNADERQVALDRQRGDGRQRADAPRDSDRLSSRRAGDL